MPKYLNVYTYNLTESEKDELYSRKLEDIRCKEGIKEKKNKVKDELCI